MSQSPPLFKRSCSPVRCDLECLPAGNSLEKFCIQQKADLVPNIARSALAFRSCLGFILIFKCPGEMDIIICGWRSTIFFFFLSLIPATVPPFVINGLWWIERFLTEKERKKDRVRGEVSRWHPSTGCNFEYDWDYEYINKLMGQRQRWPREMG